MSECRFFDTNEPDAKANCDNCRRFIYKKCMNHWRLMDDYQAGKEDEFDRIMREYQEVKAQ